MREPVERSNRVVQIVIALWRSDLDCRQRYRLTAESEDLRDRFIGTAIRTDDANRDAEQRAAFEPCDLVPERDALADNNEGRRPQLRRSNLFGDLSKRCGYGPLARRRCSRNDGGGPLDMQAEMFS